MRLLKLLLLLFVCVAGPAAAGSLEAGEAAHDRGDYATAMRLLRPFADQGLASAQFHLGLMYDVGQGVPQDYAAARVWYRKAADQGIAEAQYNLGLMYEHGHGVQDYAAAVTWYRKAANQGFALAQHNLGVMYGEGHGVTQDYVHAHMWLNLAAAAANLPKRHLDLAVNNRDVVATKMTPAQLAEAQRLAREWKPKPER